MLMMADGSLSEAAVQQQQQQQQQQILPASSHYHNLSLKAQVLSAVRRYGG
jgi:type II secretory pathway component PulL